MYQIQQITSDPFQYQKIILPDGSAIDLTLYFMPMQQTWLIYNMVYAIFEVDNFRISNSPNLFRQFKNNLPFGLTCITKVSREPSQLQDFSSGAFGLYILTPAEVQAYESYLSG